VNVGFRSIADIQVREHSDQMKSVRFALLLPMWCTACAPAYSDVTVSAAVGSQAWVNPMQAPVKVQPDVFSGRPNPVWMLTGRAARSLAERLATLPPAAPRKLSTNLGYRGFIVTIPQPTGDITARIQNGIAEITRGGRIDYYQDRNRALERWLILTCEASVPTDPQRIVHPPLQ
jgi:hypothetical protein